MSLPRLLAQLTCRSRGQGSTPIETTLPKVVAAPPHQPPSRLPALRWAVALVLLASARACCPSSLSQPQAPPFCPVPFEVGGGWAGYYVRPKNPTACRALQKLCSSMATSCSIAVTNTPYNQHQSHVRRCYHQDKWTCTAMLQQHSKHQRKSDLISVDQHTSLARRSGPACWVTPT